VSAGTFASVAEATTIIERIRVYGSDPLVELAEGHWLWTDPGPNGRGPWLSFCEAFHGDTPANMLWVCTCEAEDRGCVRPSHFTLIKEGEAPPVHPAVVSEFARRIREERTARRDARAFAREIGVAQSTVRSWERGETHPGRDVEDRLAKRFGWDNKPRRWITTIVFQSVDIADSAGAAAALALQPLEREGFPLKAVIHSVSQVT
jgi:transcriptional regulator with XRE-family HTH domain